LAGGVQFFGVLAGGGFEQANLLSVAAAPTAGEEVQAEPEGPGPAEGAIQLLGLEAGRRFSGRKVGSKGVFHGMKLNWFWWVGRSGLLFDPVCFEATAQGHPRAMEHDPEIAFGDVQEAANFRAGQAVDFAKGKNGVDILGSLRAQAR
jgi:hypothetical protein